ncbi:MAG: L-threonylcarbamoyladenylate synthase [Candidatus Paceibacterota bacterium]
MKIINLNEENTKKIIKETIDILKNGGVVMFPTDTVYGLLADATNKKAVDKVFQIKKRDYKKSLPIFISDISEAKKLAAFGSREEKFLNKNWPGQVTAILKRKDTKKNIYGVEKDTIALRVPDFSLLNIVLEKINRPLIGTSANISGKPSSTNFEDIMKQFKREKYKPDLAVKIDFLPKRKPSKIIDLTSFPFKVLRE